MNKYIKFNEIPVDTEQMTVALILQIREARTAKEDKYCIITMSDGEIQVDAKLWNRSKEDCKLEEGMLATVFLEKQEYKGAASFILRKYMDPPKDAEFSDFIVCAPYRPEEMYNSILKTMRAGAPKKDGVTFDLIDLTEELYKENEEAIMKSSAAQSMHHNYASGLLYHTFRMLRLGVCALRVYPDLDAELLLAGIALHDIGKLIELSTDFAGAADYTLEGRLFGHLFLGPEMIEAFINNTQTDIPKERIMLLKHMLASHHGKLEWGAITVPAIPEAMVLHQIDMIDSRMDMFEQAYKGMESGTLSESRIFGLDNARVYKKEEETA